MIASKKAIQNINETKIWFFEKINKIDKPLTRLIKKKKGTQISKVRSERGKLTTDTTEIERIIRMLQRTKCEQVDNLEEMGKFLETCDLQKHNQEETKNLNILITTNEIEAVIKKIPIKS